MWTSAGKSQQNDTCQLPPTVEISVGESLYCLNHSYSVNSSAWSFTNRPDFTHITSVLLLYSHCMSVELVPALLILTSLHTLLLLENPFKSEIVKYPLFCQDICGGRRFRRWFSIQPHSGGEEEAWKPAHLAGERESAAAERQSQHVSLKGVMGLNEMRKCGL